MPCNPAGSTIGLTSGLALFALGLFLLLDAKNREAYSQSLYMLPISLMAAGVVGITAGIAGLIQWCKRPSDVRIQIAEEGRQSQPTQLQPYSAVPDSPNHN